MTPTRELRLPGEDDLRDFVVAQRWFGSKSREVAHFRVLETIPLTEQPLGIAVLEVEFLPGTHELYQLLVGVRRHLLLFICPPAMHTESCNSRLMKR